MVGVTSIGLSCHSCHRGQAWGVRGPRAGHSMLGSGCPHISQGQSVLRLMASASGHPGFCQEESLAPAMAAPGGGGLADPSKLSLQPHRNCCLHRAQD